MKKISYFCVFLLLVLFVPRVYAFTYEIDMNVSKTSVSVGTETEIKVSLKDVQGTSDSIATCSLNVQLDNNIVLNPKVRSLGSWTMTVGNFYLFDTGDAVTGSSDFFVIPIKVNGEGSIRLVDIVCSDGNTNETLDDKSISFTISNTSNNNQSNSNTTNNVQQNNQSNNSGALDSNCDLVNIQLSEGTIEFDAGVTEYSLEVSDYENLIVTPVLSSETSTFVVDRRSAGNNKSIVITVSAEDGSSKVYTIYINQITDTESNNKEDNSMNYVPIFIAILCVLVLINVFRIVKNRRNNVKS